MKPLSVYIHIPFCVQKCLYCDFLSHKGEREEQLSYTEALKKELQSKAPLYKDYVVTTLFVGGGTPSVLPRHLLAEIIDVLKQNYAILPEGEWSIEVNPGTVAPEKFLAYKEMGFNRLSIGAQSLQDEELSALGRIHNSTDFYRAYEMANRAGFTNINVDIMTGIPRQSKGSLTQTLKAVLELEPPPTHISAYSLIVEEGTPFYEDTPPLPSEEEDREMVDLTAELLAAGGYEQYEISNYAKEGMECAHNCVYWERGDYVGFGLGASSMVSDRRFQNTSDMGEYLRGKTVCTEQLLCVEEQMEEFMFLGLRMRKGVSERVFFETFHKTFDEVYKGVSEPYEKLGYLQRIYEDDGPFYTLRLTREGMHVSNPIMADFLLT